MMLHDSARSPPEDGNSDDEFSRVDSDLDDLVAEDEEGGGDEEAGGAGGTGMGRKKATRGRKAGGKEAGGRRPDR